MRTLLVILLVLAGCEQSRISGPSLIAFHAAWCQPCQRDAPLLAEVSKEFPITEIDFESQHAVAVQYRVSVLPTYIVLSGGEEVMRTMNIRTAIQALRSLDQ
jgi:thioredoxin 1